MRYEEVLEIIEKIAPPDLAEPWDNSGIQIRTGIEINRILVCLEITDAVIDEAENGGYDFIISHHPLIFDPLRSIDVCSADAAAARQSQLACRLIKAGIGVYSAHTSFDNAPEGNNVYAARLLGACDITGPGPGLEGSLGTLKEKTDLAGFCKTVGEALGLEKGYIKTVGPMSTAVSRIAVCTGAGGIFIDAALREGADVLVTGDLKFDQAQKALHHGLCVIDAGHYGTEKIFAENFASQMRGSCGSLTVDESRDCTDPYNSVSYV